MSNPLAPSVLRVRAAVGTLPFSLALALPTLAPPSVGAQEATLLQGVVAEDDTGRLIPSAVVTLLASGRETRTGPDGTFAFVDVPLGSVLLRAQAPGYPAVVDEATVVPGAVIFVQMFLPRTAAFLEELLVTGARQPEFAGLGARTAADLVARQIPHLQGFTAPFNSTRGRAFNPTVQLRGSSSLSSDEEPVIVLDGARVTGGMGRAMDILRQIPASQIKEIQILRGPTSAHLFGSAAGVISIQTVSGRP
jgi:hypothetical protein